MGPSSLLRDGVYQVCSGPLIPPERWGLSIVQWAPHLWLCLIDEVYPVCSGPLIPDSALEMRWTNNPVCSGPLVPNFAWNMRFTQCATSPSSILRDEVYQVCSGPLIPSWEMRFIDCAVSPSSLTLPDRWGLPSVQPAHHLSWEMRFI